MPRITVDINANPKGEFSKSHPIELIFQTTGMRYGLNVSEACALIRQLATAIEMLPRSDSEEG